MQTVHAGVGDWIAPYSDEPEKVREFCVRHGVLDYLRTAVELVQRNFAPIEKLTLSMWKDPLEGTEKARIIVTIRADIEESSRRYWRFLGEWTPAVPLPDRDRIRISYISE